jgi:hypothetical protein
MGGDGSNWTEGIWQNFHGIRQDGEQWDFLARDLTRIAAALRVDPKCVAWLQSTVGPDRFARILDNLQAEFAVAEAFYAKDGTIDEDLAITDDVPGASYRTVVNYSSYSADHAAYRWDTILHELAHIVGPEGFIQNDGDSDEAQLHNEKLIEANCFQTLKAARE